MRRCGSKFTLCLPGSPKVNAGGVCALGCRGVGCLRGFRIQRSQSREIGAATCGEGPNLDPGMFERSCAGPAIFAGTEVDGLV